MNNDLYPTTGPKPFVPNTRAQAFVHRPKPGSHLPHEIFEPEDPRHPFQWPLSNWRMAFGRPPREDAFGNKLTAERKKHWKAWRQACENQSNESRKIAQANAARAEKERLNSLPQPRRFFAKRWRNFKNFMRIIGDIAWHF